jgi:hypothetical protein
MKFLIAILLFSYTLFANSCVKEAKKDNPNIEIVKTKCLQEAKNGKIDISVSYNFISNA